MGVFSHRAFCTKFIIGVSNVRLCNIGNFVALSRVCCGFESVSQSIGEGVADGFSVHVGSSVANTARVQTYVGFVFIETHSTWAAGLNGMR